MNGTLELNCHRPGRSDSWHLVQDYLRPILTRRHATLYDAAFLKLLETWVGRDNRIVFMDRNRRGTVVINRERGFMLGQIWLSNARWLNTARFPLPVTPVPTSPTQGALRFSH